MKYADDAYTTLASSMTAGDVDFDVVSAASFPAITGDEWFPVTLERLSDGAKETVRVTAVSGVNFTVSRSYYDDTPLAFSAGDRVSIRVGEAVLNAMYTDLGGPVNVKTFGATGGGVTDDTAAIQAAIDYAEALVPPKAAIYIPGGNYLVSATLTVSGSNLSIVGDGVNSSTLTRTTDYGSTLLFDASTDYISYVHLRDFCIANNATSPCTQGAEVHFIAGVSCVIENVRTTGKSFIGMLFEGCGQMALSAVNVRLTGAYDSSRYGLSFTDRPVGYPGSPGNNSAISITGSVIDTSWLNGVGDASFRYGVYMDAIDGFYCENTRIGGATTANVCLSGSDASNDVAHVMFSNCFFDLNPGRAVLTQDTSSTTFQNLSITNCHFGGATTHSTYAIDLQGDISDVGIVNNRFVNWGDGAINITGSSTNIRVVGNGIYKCNRNASATNETVNVSGSWTGSGLVIDGNIIQGDSLVGSGINLNAGSRITVNANQIKALANAVVIASGVTDFHVVNNNLLDNTDSIADASGAVDKVIEGNLIVEARSIASASSITPTLGSGYYLITGTTNITSIGVLPSCSPPLVLRFADALTVVDGGNLKLAGDFATTAGDVLTLISDGTDWVEMSRSAN